MSNPATVAEPESAVSTPANMRTVVVFPAPSGPTKPKISPGCTSKHRRSTARTPGKRFVRSDIAIAAGMIRYCGVASTTASAGIPGLSSWFVLSKSILMR